MKLYRNGLNKVHYQYKVISIESSTLYTVRVQCITVQALKSLAAAGSCSLRSGQ